MNINKYINRIDNIRERERERTVGSGRPWMGAPVTRNAPIKIRSGKRYNIPRVSYYSLSLKRKERGNGLI